MESKSYTVRSWTSDDESMRKLEAIQERRKEMCPKESQRYYCYSNIIRDAIDSQYRVEIAGESIIHPDDPRYN